MSHHANPTHTTVLITGATGNVGQEVIRALLSQGTRLNIRAGVRNIEKDSKELPKAGVQAVLFDFMDASTHTPALQNCDLLFLLRPPQISDVNTFFKPLIVTAREAGVQHIIFLSVQGAENSKFIPHYKIEQLIIQSGIPYTFLRPAYFMQNFSTTLRHDLVKKQRVFLPAGKAKFTIIDVADIGKVAAKVIETPSHYLTQALELTNYEQLNFGEMTDIISQETGRNIRYISPNLLSFFIAKKREGVPTIFILVMIMLHYLPRFTKTPNISKKVEEITGNTPKTFRAFVAQNKHLLINQYPKRGICEFDFLTNIIVLLYSLPFHLFKK
jgi:uncharacterized protein YbjT (DUF2867 family)